MVHVMCTQKDKMCSSEHLSLRRNRSVTKVWQCSLKQQISSKSALFKAGAAEALTPCVTLEAHVPVSIHLNRSCELHMVQHMQQGAEHSVWDTVAPSPRSVLVAPLEAEPVVRDLPATLLSAG